MCDNSFLMFDLILNLLTQMLIRAFFHVPFAIIFPIETGDTKHAFVGFVSCMSEAMPVQIGR